jgi:uncharacterized membrane protein
MRSRLKSWPLALAFILLILALLPGHAAAQDKSLVWHRWDSDIQINSDGTFHVSEVFEIEFVGGPFTFGYRNIPKSQFEGLQNFSVREGGVQYAQDRSESANTFYVTENSDEYVINWFYPSTTNETRVFTVEYTVVGGIIINADVGDRFFWKAVGPDHAFPIESSTVTVHMPPGATVDTSIEPATFGPNATYRISDDQTAVTFYAENIPANQEFEVGVRFPHGFIPAEKPSWQAAYEREQTWNDRFRPALNLALGGLGALILIGGSGGVFLLWTMRGRDPKVGPVPSYLAEPPSNLPPGVAGTLVDEKADMQDIIATLVDLARRGAIDMQEEEKKVFGLTTSKDFVFHKNEDYDQPLRDYEKVLIEKMFGSRSEVDLDDLRNKFYTAVPKIQSRLYDEAVEQGLFPQNPKKVRSRWTALGIGGLVLSVALGCFTAAAFASRIDAILCPFVSMGFASLVMAIVGRAMPVKTREGAEEAAKWKAFKEYLRNVEQYKDLETVTDQFDDYLPYAIAFGLERGWVNKFSRVPGTPVPRWYYPVGMPYYGWGSSTRGRQASTGGAGTGGMRDLKGEAVRPAPSLDSMSQSMFGGLSSMSDGLFSMLNSTASTFRSTPSSSGSSGGGGFSGGGFSGGGFSGGGGGGGGGAGFG